MGVCGFLLNEDLRFEKSFKVYSGLVQQSMHSCKTVQDRIFSYDTILLPTFSETVVYWFGLGLAWSGF